MRRLLALLFVAIALTALTACGGDDADTSDASSAEEDSGADESDASDVDDEEQEEEDESPEGIPGVEAFDITDNSHAEGSIDYDQSPPVGGPHNPVWANCDFYSSEVPSENVVHALEHGAVWITYDDVDDDTLEALEEIADDNGYVLVSEYPDQDDPLVLSAWNRQLAVDDIDDPRVQEFIDTYVGADTAPEPGAPCDGGVG